MGHPTRGPRRAATGARVRRARRHAGWSPRGLQSGPSQQAYDAGGMALTVGDLVYSRSTHDEGARVSHKKPAVPKPTRRGVRGKRWQGDKVARVVYDALAPPRDLDDPESVTVATVALLEAVPALLERPLTKHEGKRLHDLAATERPSAIIRLLHRWNGGITDRLARRLQKRSDISDLVWG